MADIHKLSFRETDVGRTIAELQSELAKLRKPHRLGGIAAHFQAGGEQRIFQLEALITHMELHELTVFQRPGEAETTYARRITKPLRAEKTGLG